ncbi:hypothetical protein FA95DRAFT_1501723, partial [Auriscalpium vulgare]
MVQVVNNLTSKQETGGPMASMYLLQHPDHYVLHKFEKLHWKNYVNEVSYYWDPNEAETVSSDPTVVVKNIRGFIVSQSATMDYTQRPTPLKSMSLHKWAMLCTKVRMQNKKGKASQQHRSRHSEDSESDTDDMDDLESDMDDDGLMLAAQDPDSDYIPNNAQSKKSHVMSNTHSFPSTHPQYETHQVRVCKESKAKVPNFGAVPLPRRDQGNIEEYCMTMLTLFKPWSHPSDLKEENLSWQEAFDSYSFSDAEKRYMDFMQIRYECNDARDDYAAKRKAGIAEGNISGDVIAHLMGDMEPQPGVHNLDDTFNLEELAEQLQSQWQVIGKRTLNRMCQMDQIEKVMTEAGWLERSITETPDQDMEEPFFGAGKSASHWKQVLALEKETIVNNRLAQAEKANNGATENTQTMDTTKYVDTVKLVDRAYLQESHHPGNKREQQVATETVKLFT